MTNPTSGFGLEEAAMAQLDDVVGADSVTNARPGQFQPGYGQDSNPGDDQAVRGAVGKTLKPPWAVFSGPPPLCEFLRPLLHATTHDHVLR